MEKNQRAFDLGGSGDESVAWNLGICATVSGDTDTALLAWKALGLAVDPRPVRLA